MAPGGAGTARGINRLINEFEFQRFLVFMALGRIAN